MTEIHEKGPLAPAKGAAGMRRASQLAILLQLAVSSTIWCYLPRRGGKSAMPDASGQLTTEDNTKIQAWWVGRWKAPVVCQVCKSQEWNLGSHVVNIMRHANDALAPNTPNYPHIIVGCKTCGHAMFFNAVQIGISVPYSPLPPPPSPPANTLFNLIQPPPPPPPFAFSLPPIPEKKG